MKNYKKVMAGICCLCTAFSVCACGGGGGTHFESESVDLENDILSGSLNIRVWDGGFGYQWLDNVIVEFNKRYPDVDIEVYDSTEKQQVLGDAIGKGNQYDLIFSELILTDYAQECLEPIDDVYQYTNKGEESSVADKIMPIYIDY